MALPGLKDKLELLHQVILQERDAARKLSMEELTSLSREKEKLLNDLQGIEELSEEERELADKIRSENRRNAYFFWNALNFVRDSMGFLAQRSDPQSYGGEGNTISDRFSGKILSGKV